MKWDAKPKEEWQWGFALLPVETVEGVIVWLEAVEVRDTPLPPDASIVEREYRLRRDRKNWLESAVDVSMAMERKKKREESTRE